MVDLTFDSSILFRLWRISSSVHSAKMAQAYQTPLLPHRME
jgi:hypothetical protein